MNKTIFERKAITLSVPATFDDLLEKWARKTERTKSGFVKKAVSFYIGHLMEEERD